MVGEGATGVTVGVGSPDNLKLQNTGVEFRDFRNVLVHLIRIAITASKRRFEGEREHEKVQTGLARGPASSHKMRGLQWKVDRLVQPAIAK